MALNRTYNTLRFFRGKKKNAELTRLSDEERDFEYRRLFIEESEIDLHVAFSRGEIFKLLSWGVISLAVVSFFQFSSIAALFLLATSLVLQLISVVFKYRFKKIAERTQFTLLIVDNVIQNTYGISLPKYL